MQKTIQLYDKTFGLFITTSQINEAIAQMASKINNDYAGKNPLFIAILNGSFLFAADLFRGIDGTPEISFIKVASYTGTESSGQVADLIGINENISNRDLIILEDIVDTGSTLEKIISSLNAHQPKSIAVATLLYKPEAYKKSIPLQYIGISIPNDFIVGFGLDYNGIGRNLNAIYKLQESENKEAH